MRQKFSAEKSGNDPSHNPIRDAVCDRMEGDAARLSRMAGRGATTAEKLLLEICQDGQNALSLHCQKEQTTSR